MSVVSALVAGPLAAGLFGATLGFGYGVTAGAVFSLVVGFLNGGFACLQHLVLRSLLIRNRLTPLRYVSFLSQMVELGLLERKGGAYEFRHQKIREFFSQLRPRVDLSSALVHPLVESEWHAKHVLRK